MKEIQKPIPTTEKFKILTRKELNALFEERKRLQTRINKLREKGVDCSDLYRRLDQINKEIDDCLAGTEFLNQKENNE